MTITTHRCQVKMRYDFDAPDDCLVECGDTASKKIGQVWICDYHYAMFRVPEFGEDYYLEAKSATDSLGSRTILWRVSRGA
jgi:hypothetical protein